MQHSTSLRSVVRFASLAAIGTAVAGPWAPEPVARASVTMLNHFPRLENSETVVSGIQIQNLERIHPALIWAHFQHDDGAPPFAISRGGLLPGSAANFFLPMEQVLPTGAYGVNVESDRTIASIARTDWRAAGGAAMTSHALADLDVIVPLAVKQGSPAAAHTSRVTIQNTSTSAVASVTASFVAAGLTAPAATKALSLSPGRSATIDLATDPDFAQIPRGSVGWMRVEAGEPVAVQSLNVAAPGERAIYGFEGVPAARADKTLYAPLIRNDFFGTSGISVVNPGAGPVDVTVRYIGSPLSNAAACRQGAAIIHGGRPATIPAESSAVFYQADIALPDTGASGLPAGCLGSAVIEATGDVVAIVTDADAGRGTAAAYNAASASSGARRVALPLYRNQHTAAGLSTGVQAMNLGQQTASAELVIFDSSGTLISGACGAACRVRIPPLGSHTWYPPALHSLSRGIFGSAVVLSSEPIAVIVNDVPDNSRADAAVYNGIPSDG